MDGLSIWFGIFGLVSLVTAAWIFFRPSELAYIVGAGIGLVAGALLAVGMAIGYMGNEIGSPGSGPKLLSSMFPWVILQIAIVILGGILAVTWKPETQI